jgi:hypothetical protein
LGQHLLAREKAMLPFDGIFGFDRIGVSAAQGLHVSS